MFHKFACPILITLLIASLFLSACQPETKTVVQTVVVKEPGKESVIVVTASAPMPTQVSVPAPATASVSQAGLGDASTSPYRNNRMIIKNGEMNLLVADTDLAIDRVTSIAVETAGYIISSKTWLQDGFKYASLTMGVPVDQFEAAQRRLRALAVQVLNDTASGQDVSTEYVDLQSRLTNLEATAARIREFLQQAKDVEEALRVNARLTDVESEIEKVKGRMTYLKDRSAFSTLTVNLEPQRPTPTPSPTPTATPIPTPAVWYPGNTFKEASGTLIVLLQVFTDVAIWLIVLVGPFAVPIVIGLALWLRTRKKKNLSAKRTLESLSSAEGKAS